MNQWYLKRFYIFILTGIQVLTVGFNNDLKYDISLTKVETGNAND